MAELPVRREQLSRRTLLRGSLAVAGGVLLSAVRGGSARQPQPVRGIAYSFVNRTGAFADRECFWSLNGGRDWHSFAAEPTAACPAGNGRVYFRLGVAPRNFDDRRAYWDFIEYACGGGVWNGNTTQVDAFCIPLTIELGRNRVGIVESRRALFAAFREKCPREFRACAVGDYFILSPCRAGFDKNGPHGKYFDEYIDAVWRSYADGRPTPSGRWVGKIVDGALTFTPTAGGQPLRCARKPTTQEVFLGTGVLAANPQFCAAINRHVLADPADWRDRAKFYQAELCNWYAKFFHEHSLAHKAYGFCYDDVGEQAAFFSGRGEQVMVTLYWSGKGPPGTPTSQH
jgi:hypothetical protein